MMLYPKCLFTAQFLIDFVTIKKEQGVLHYGQSLFFFYYLPIGKSNGTDPSGECCTISITGTVYAANISATVIPIHNFQFSNHAGVSSASSSSSAIGNSSSPLGAKNVSLIKI